MNAGLFSWRANQSVNRVLCNGTNGLLKRAFVDRGFNLIKLGLPRAAMVARTSKNNNEIRLPKSATGTAEKNLDKALRWDTMEIREI